MRLRPHRRAFTHREATRMQLRGTLHRYGCDIDVGAIFPARYLNTSEPGGLSP
jgi:3-isopropylmalate dehydratase small subunit